MGHEQTDLVPMRRLIGLPTAPSCPWWKDSKDGEKCRKHISTVDTPACVCVPSVATPCMCVYLSLLYDEKIFCLFYSEFTRINRFWSHQTTLLYPREACCWSMISLGYPHPNHWTLQNIDPKTMLKRVLSKRWRLLQSGLLAGIDLVTFTSPRSGETNRKAEKNKAGSCRSLHNRSPIVHLVLIPILIVSALSTWL